MRITIVTIGTRGDVQPYVALARGLDAAGHETTLCTHSTFRGFVEGYGVRFAPMAGDVRAILESDAGREVLSRKNPIAMTRGMTDLAAPILRQVGLDILAATHGTDLILASSLGYFNAITASQVNNVPLIMASLQWWTPTRAFASASARPLPQGIPLSGALNRVSYASIAWILVAVAGRLLNTIRREQSGLPPLGYRDFFQAIETQRDPVIYPVSESVVPRPPEWGANVHQTGFWFLDQASTYTPPAALLDFLAADDPPVYIGFGSMSDRDPAAVGAMAREALRRTGQRGIILSGWGGIESNGSDGHDDRVFMLDGAPHDWLFPRMAAVVHHGGIGTTAEALRAGIPQVIVSYSADQPFWGAQMTRLGAASGWIRRYRLTTDKLTGLIRAAVGDARVRESARMLAARIRAEDGVARAVEVIGRLG
ncbi:MAG: glycosyltransferase [Chloroflexota bacterium]|nr:glycosyltransferase [Chloroflexota bacterium]